MNFSQEDENLLEKWITSALGQYNLPNAESITKYTITLLKKETDDPYTQCYHELESMLKPNTEDFLNNLFQVLDDGTYRLFQAENEYDEEVYDEEDERGIRRQESTSSNVHGSPTGSDGDDSYERRKRFRRRDSDASEPDQNRRTDHSPGRDHKGNSRAGGPLHSARDEHDHRDYGNNNRQRDYNNNNSNRRNNNNNFNSNSNQRGHRNNNQYNNGYNNSQSSYSHQGHSGGAPPSHYPGYAPYPGQPPMAYGGYPYDPAAAGGYYGYPPNGGWQGAPPSTSGYPPYGNNPNGYYYGANYAPPAASGNGGPPPVGPQPGPGAGYGYGSNAPSVPPQHANQEAAIVDGGDQAESDSNDTNGDTGSSSATPAHTTASSSSGNAGGYNMGKYPQYGSGGAGYQSYNGQSHASRRPAQQPARESNKANRPAVKSLPENERCTLRCTSIPVHVTEEDLKAHFESFGHVVELQVSPMEGNGNNNLEDDDTEDGKKKKKQANECLVQFYSAANARRCLTSEVPVLNNRFIFIYQSHFNIIPPQDVPRPSRDILDRDSYLLSQKEIIPAASAAQAAANRKRSALNIYTSGRTNKWRRTDGFGGGDDNKVAGDGAAMSTMRGDFREGAEEDRPTNGDEAVATPSAASKAAADEMKAALMRQKQLKQQAEELLKKKEDVLINQIEKCRTLMEKLEKAPDSDSKAKNQQYLEDKIVDLQSQLRAVREQVHQQQQQQLQQQQQQQQSANGETRPPAATGAPGFFRGGYYAGGGRFPAGGRGRGNAGGRSWNAGRNAGGRFAGGGRFPRPYLTPQTSLNNPFANAAATSETASSTNGDVAAVAGDDNGGGSSADGAAEWVGGDEQQD